MRGPTISALAVGALAVALFAAAPASASQHAPIASAHMTSAAPGGGRLAVDVRVSRFLQQGANTRAVGTVTATLSGVGATPTTVRQRVLLQVATGRTCTILTLTLDQLNLVLLGVTVHLDRVELQVTGQRRGGVLGRLFCSLAGSRLASSRTAAVRSLNHALRERPLHPLRFSVPTGRAAQAPAAGTCAILDLILGPLHLNLLGLVVDLNRVHLTITGNPAGGILGRLLCGVANASTPTVPGVPAVPAVPAVPVPGVG
jgi:hypothetical protein